MQGRESVDVGRVDVGAPFDEPVDLVLVGGRACGQKDTAISELDPFRLPIGLVGLKIGFTLLPPF